MKLKIILVVLIILLLISGCKLRQIQPDVSEPEKIEYRKGTKALEMSFLKNFPPDKIKAGKEFQVVIEVLNSGAYNIDNLILSLTGLNEKTTEVIGESKKLIDLLPGKSIEFPAGSKEIVGYKLRNIKRLPIDKHTELIKIDACYKYQTVASADICINPTNQVLQTGQPICFPDQTISLSGGQGAPVVVTKIEQSTDPVALEQGKFELELKFYISNLGKGIVSKEEGCKERGILEIQDISFSDYKLGFDIDCGFKAGNQTLVLSERDNILTCTANIYSQMGAFPTPLIIILNYWYETSIEKKIEVIQ